jgi:hypothetical protein
MKISKFFLKNLSFLKFNFFRKSLFLKSKNSTNPFRQVLSYIAFLCFFSKVSIFENIKVYKNFNLFNIAYYVNFSKSQLRNLF